MLLYVHSNFLATDEYLYLQLKLKHVQINSRENKEKQSNKQNTSEEHNGDDKQFDCLDLKNDGLKEGHVIISMRKQLNTVLPENVKKN